MNRLIVCGVAALLGMAVTAYPRGAPSCVCDDPLMEPIPHREGGSVGYINLYEYTLRYRPVNGTNIVEVTLSGPYFKGFVVRASTIGGEINQGQFIINEDSEFRALHCSKNTDIAVTHVNPMYKRTVKMLWINNNNGNYAFQATVVPELKKYVINIFAR